MAVENITANYSLESTYSLASLSAFNTSSTHKGSKLSMLSIAPITRSPISRKVILPSLKRRLASSLAPLAIAVATPPSERVFFTGSQTFESIIVRFKESHFCRFEQDLIHRQVTHIFPDM